jgi:hypothetical protein
MGSVDINTEWRGHTVVLGMQFKVDPLTWDCDLILDLADGDKQGAGIVRVEFRGVSGLSLKKFGGGLTQVLYLVAEDIRDRQLDQLMYQIRELERDSISFMCGSIQITKKYLLDKDAIEAAGWAPPSA